MKFTNVHEAAKAYIQRGFRVVPLHGVDRMGCHCGSGACKERDWGKHEPPATDGLWKDGATFTAADFSDGDNIAVAMGPWRPSLWLVALDIDGSDSIAELPELPPTLTQRSPRGRHLIYSVPEYTPLGNYVDVFRTKAWGYSLDLRYARGRIVAAPSRGATGDYVWDDWRDPVPLPESALDAILDERRRRGLPVASRWERDGKAP
jgi:hypothetical protein